jgi:hypothetical protein
MILILPHRFLQRQHLHNDNHYPFLFICSSFDHRKTWWFLLLDARLLLLKMLIVLFSWFLSLVAPHLLINDIDVSFFYFAPNSVVLICVVRCNCSLYRQRIPGYLVATFIAIVNMNCNGELQYTNNHYCWAKGYGNDPYNEALHAAMYCACVCIWMCGGPEVTPGC